MTADLHEQAETRQRWEDGYLVTRRQLWLRRWRIRRFLDAAEDARIVEIGSGDGLNLRVLRELGCRRVVGVEYSLDLAARSAYRRVAVGDGHELPLADVAFDVVFVDSVLHHLVDYGRAAAEVHRVIRPGGALLYFEPRPSLARRLLDGVTFSSASRFVPFLDARRRTLLEEMDLYSRWLRDHREMEDGFRRAGLRLRFYRRGPIGMFVCFERPAEGEGS